MAETCRRRTIRSTAFIVPACFFLLLPYLAFAQNLSSGADLAGLYSLRASLGLRARDWPRKEDPCSQWSGVGCRDGRVVSVDLHGLRRTRIGRLSPRFAVDGIRQLKRLETFNASGFALPGPIPDWFGTLLSVSVLDLSGASVNGSIPESLGGAAGLRSLSLAGNSISGAIPIAFGQLSELRNLVLSSNSLSGSVPPSLGSLSSLQTLAVADNSLTGAIPPKLGQLSNLTLLDLSSNALYGSIPPAIGRLSSLRTLDLHNNSLSGSIPPEIGDLSLLVTLDLGLNLLVGPLPSELQNLKGLQSLQLGNNSLTGSLPGVLFAAVSQLQSITLSYNNFTGALPDSFWTLQGLQTVDFSHNGLTGSFPVIVPSSDGAGSNADGARSAFILANNLYYGSVSSGFASNILARFSSVDLSENYFQGMEPTSSIGTRNVYFQGNCFKNASDQRNIADCVAFYATRGIPYAGPVSPSPAPAPPGSSKKKSGWSLKFILIGVFSGIAFLLILVAISVLCLMRQGGRAADNRDSGRNTMPSGTPPPTSSISMNLSAVGDSFTYDQLVEATSGFDEANLIKHGHSGDLYHGTLEGSVSIVVKRINLHMLKKEPYVAELDFFAKASHTRLVPFMGHCLGNDDEKFLVYKFMPNADLSNALHKKKGSEEEGLKSLDWITRLKIATGVAEALCFLHHECNPPLVHRDIQASSILLEDKFEVRLGSLSEVCPQEGDGHQRVITRLLRLSQTPESSSSGSQSATCAYDVYCFGKVLLELVTGKLGISGSNDSTAAESLENSLQYINIYEKDLVTNIVDPFLVVDEDHLEEVWAIAIIAKSCLNPKPSKRPLTRYILKALENPLKVVRDDTSSGSGRLRAASSRGSWNTAIFGSWRHNDAGVQQQREDRSGGLKRSTTLRSQGSNGEHSFSHKRPSKEIFPEPSGVLDS